MCGGETEETMWLNLMIRNNFQRLERKSTVDLTDQKRDQMGRRCWNSLTCMRCMDSSSSCFGGRHCMWRRKCLLTYSAQIFLSSAMSFQELGPCKSMDWSCHASSCHGSCASQSMSWSEEARERSLSTYRAIESFRYSISLFGPFFVTGSKNSSWLSSIVTVFAVDWACEIVNREARDRRRTSFGFDHGLKGMSSGMTTFWSPLDEHYPDCWVIACTSLFWEKRLMKSLTSSSPRFRWTSLQSSSGCSSCCFALMLCHHLRQHLAGKKQRLEMTITSSFGEWKGRPWSWGSMSKLYQVRAKNRLHIPHIHKNACSGQLLASVWALFLCIRLWWWCPELLQRRRGHATTNLQNVKYLSWRLLAFINSSPIPWCSWCSVPRSHIPPNCSLMTWECWPQAGIQSQELSYLQRHPSGQRFLEYVPRAVRKKLKQVCGSVIAFKSILIHPFRYDGRFSIMQPINIVSSFLHMHKIGEFMKIQQFVPSLNTTALQRMKGIRSYLPSWFYSKCTVPEAKK